jgi:hypothetical protein
LNEPKNKNKHRRLSPKYFWFLLALLIIETSVLIALFLSRPASPYIKLFPKDITAVSYFSQSSLNELFKQLQNNDSAWPPLSLTDKMLKESLNKIKIESPEQLFDVFEDQAVFLLLPASSTPKLVSSPIQSVLPENASTTDNQTQLISKPASTGQSEIIQPPSLNWLVMATLKANDDKFNKFREQAEKALKQNYNLIFETYRQIKITQIKPLNQKPEGLYFAEIKNYFILTNRQETLKETIDKAIR